MMLEVDRRSASHIFFSCPFLAFFSLSCHVLNIGWVDELTC